MKLLKKRKIKDDFDTQVGMPTRLGTMSGVMEDAPAVSAGAGAVAGIGIGPKGEPGIKKKPPLIRRTKFAGMQIYEVDADFYHRCRLGKKKYAKYSDYVGEDETGQEIRAYGRNWKTKNNPILIQDKSTGYITFLKYGKNRN